MSTQDPESPNSGGPTSSTSNEFCSISEALKLIHTPFSGDKNKLREFLDNCDAAFSLVHESQHEKLLKFVKAKIVGDAKSKLLVRSTTDNWSNVKDILKENYSIRRTIDFYACTLFNARQEKGENIADWGSRIDSLQSQLKEAAVRILTPSHVSGAASLVQHLAKASFVQGLSDERIQLIVRSKDVDRLSLGDIVEICLEQESNQLSVRDKSDKHLPKINSKGEHKRKIICHFCKKPGHIEAVCRLKQKRGLQVRNVRCCVHENTFDNGYNCEESSQSQMCSHAKEMHDGQGSCQTISNDDMKCFSKRKQGFETQHKDYVNVNCTNTNNYREYQHRYAGNENRK